MKNKLVEDYGALKFRVKAETNDDENTSRNTLATFYQTVYFLLLKQIYDRHK